MLLTSVIRAVSFRSLNVIVERVWLKPRVRSLKLLKLLCMMMTFFLAPSLI